MNDSSPSDCLYGNRPGRARCAPGDACWPNWSARLPLEWRDQVVPPVSFRVFREFEIPARRLFGDDEMGQVCHCAHDYRLLDPRSDDDEEFYTALAYSESVIAWRLKDGRWLVYRRVESLGTEGGCDSGFSLEARMPR